VNSALLDRVVALARLLAAACLLLAPGLALSYWLFPRRTLDLLERVYLGALSSLSLLTLFGVALLGEESGLDPWLLASCALACTAACVAGASIPRLHRRRAQESGAKPGGVACGTRIWVHGTRSYIPALFVARIYPVPARTRRGRHRTRRVGPGRSIKRAVRAEGSSLDTSRAARSAWGPLGLLATIAVTLFAYHACAAHPLPGGPAAAFSVPSDRLADTQSSLQQGGRLAIPFQVENLASYDAAYRVEAWAPTQDGAAGDIAAVAKIAVAAGATHCGALQVDLPPGTEDTAVDLYLYPADAVVPLASLRLWPLDTSTYPR